MLFRSNEIFNGHDKPVTYWSLSFEHGAKIQLFKSVKEFDQLKTLEKKKYNKSFLNFNRRWRLHRPAVVALLYVHNLIDKGYVSLAADTDDNLNWNKVYDSIVTKIKDDKEFYKLIVDNKSKILSLPNFYLDTNNLSINRPRLIENDIPFEDTKKLYENTYFSLVSETFFFDSDSVFFTEKVFKPIVYKHPFVLISAPQQLSSLHKLGYKTFHPFINESYDKELDDVKRLRLIIEEVDRLSNLTEVELFEFIDNVKPIVEHNLNTLRSKPYYGHLHKLIG